ncbi:hypothetical protein [Pseudoalteromonas sp. S558]|uniref:hypothetical protein n=1 Tax=Pseudoalteromonas sp. S558 TaxID=2066515 RepID=UPI00110AD0C5|nr:hypothetical protein [Pseudoalteromonas sp. S558]TMO01312.1 hypothetical protein CWB66_15060 [Pseudoalteromonas sp. S558]
MSFKQLRKFSKDELLFDEKETRVILKFIFKPADHKLIDSLPINDRLKGFAQGLLVEAIDASYSVGYVKAIFESTANPTKGAMAIIKTFARKAASHWFKHTSVHDLQKVKIFDFIRDRLALAFKSELQLYLVKNENNRAGAFVVYQIPKHGSTKLWV